MTDRASAFLLRPPGLLITKGCGREATSDQISIAVFTVLDAAA